MKETVEFDTDDEGGAHDFETYRMSSQTRRACFETLYHIRNRLKYYVDYSACEELEAVRAVLLEELDGWEP